MNKKEIAQLSGAIADLTSADSFLKNSVEKLSKFGTKVPSLPPQALEYCCHTVNELICRIEHIWKVKLIKLDESEKTATCLEEFIEVTKVKQ